MKISSVFMGCVLLAIFVTMVAIAASYPAGARFQPFVIGIPAIALCILQIVLDIVQRKRQAAGSGDGGNEFARAEAEISKATGRKVEFEVARQEMPKEESLPEESELGREILVWLFFLGFIAAVIGLGFWIAIPVFIFGFLVVMSPVGTPRALILAAIGTAIFYSLFELVLRVKVFEGFYGPWLWDQVRAALAAAGVPLRL